MKDKNGIKSNNFNSMKNLYNRKWFGIKFFRLQFSFLKLCSTISNFHIRSCFALFEICGGLNTPSCVRILFTIFKYIFYFNLFRIRRMNIIFSWIVFLLIKLFLIKRKSAYGILLVCKPLISLRVSSKWLDRTYTDVFC